MIELSREIKRSPPAGSPCGPGVPIEALSPCLRGRTEKGDSRYFGILHLSLIVFFCFILFGCAPKASPPPAAEPAHNSSTSAPESQDDGKSSLPDGQFGAENLTVAKRDLGTGKLLWELKAKRGSGQAKDGKIVGTLQEVQGVLYKDGQPTLRFEAENAKADSDAQRVAAWGRVKAVSHVNKAKLSAEKITWEAKRDLVTAEGNVRIQWGDFEMLDNRLHVDTALQRAWRED